MELEIPREVQCPYCGSSFTCFIDTSIANQMYTEDCHICCKPIVFTVQANPGEILSLDLQSE